MMGHPYLSVFSAGPVLNEPWPPRERGQWPCPDLLPDLGQVASSLWDFWEKQQGRNWDPLGCYSLFVPSDLGSPLLCPALCLSRLTPVKGINEYPCQLAPVWFGLWEPLAGDWRVGGERDWSISSSQALSLVQALWKRPLLGHSSCRAARPLCPSSHWAPVTLLSPLDPVDLGVASIYL